jgi:hypothetical protein
MWTTTATPPVERSVKVAQPVTFEPLRDSIVAFACGPAAGFGVDAQPARASSPAVATAAAARVPLLVFILSSFALPMIEDSPARGIPVPRRVECRGRKDGE